MTTNRDKLEALRAALGEVVSEADKGTRAATQRTHHVLAELIGLLLGADGPRSPMAAERAIQVGDEVRTRGGGPKMVVIGMPRPDDPTVPFARVGWWLNESTAPMFQDRLFPAAALVRCEDEERTRRLEQERDAMLRRVHGALSDLLALMSGRQDIDRDEVMARAETAASELGGELY